METVQQNGRFTLFSSKFHSGNRKLLCELSKLSKLNAFNLLGYSTNTDASLLVYKFRPERELVFYVRRVNATAINFPYILTLRRRIYYGHALHLCYTTLTKMKFKP